MPNREFFSKEREERDYNAEFINKQWKNMEEALYFIYNNSDGVSFNENAIKNDIFDALRSLQTIKGDKEFLQKYSQLWSKFLRATLFLDRIFVIWISVWLNPLGRKLNASEMKIIAPKMQNAYDEDWTIIDDETLPRIKNYIKDKEFVLIGKDYYVDEDDAKGYREFWDPYVNAMQSWKEVFFRTLNNRMFDIVARLVEKENDGDKFINTKLITDKIISSFKVLDVFNYDIENPYELTINFKILNRPNGLIGWDIKNLLNFDELSITPLDHYKFMRHFYDLVYTKIPRALDGIITEDELFGEILENREKNQQSLEKTGIQYDEIIKKRRLQNNESCRKYRMRLKTKREKRIKELEEVKKKNMVLEQKIAKYKKIVDKLKLSLENT